MLVLDEGVDDHGPKLEDLPRHVPGAPAEPTPVGKNDQRKVLPFAKVGNGLRRLVRRVGIPHLPGLRHESFAASRVGGVGRDPLLHEPRLHGNHPHGDAAQPGPPHHHRLAPLGQVLLEAPLVEKPRHEPLRRVDAGQHVARVVGGLGGQKRDLAVHGVGGSHLRRGQFVGGRHETEPVHNLFHARLVVGHHQVRHAVGGHHFRPT
mmetsp:Transcript_9172/g.18473  ORF Transcript_9172/g.18473 Transcript_9172/m.18473 type:complete len:206 (-) Transcript_9172:773-1390(-)